jgi:hypothetical protein
MCGQGVCQTLFPSGHFLAPLGTPPPLRQRSPDPVARGVYAFCGFDFPLPTPYINSLSFIFSSTP